MISNVTFLSEVEAMLLVPNENDAIISITDSDKDVELNYYWKDENIFRISFNDAEEQEEGCCYTLFDEEMAETVFNFINKLHCNTVDIKLVIHCSAGISRSAGIAKYVAETYNLGFPAHYTKHNKRVYSMLKGIREPDKKEVDTS